jgi:hypothetical protein
VEVAQLAAFEPYAKRHWPLKTGTAYKVNLRVTDYRFEVYIDDDLAIQGTLEISAKKTAIGVITDRAKTVVSQIKAWNLRA